MKDRKIERLTERLFQIKGYERGIATKCCASSWIGSWQKYKQNKNFVEDIFGTIDKNEYIL